MQAGLEGVFRRPAELAIELGKIDGVAEVVPGPIGYKGDQLAMRAAVGHGQDGPSRRRLR